MSPHRLGLQLPVAAAILALSACPNPLTDLTVSQLSDKASPVITFSSPAEGSAYTQTVLVLGTAAEAGRIKELTWTVTGTYNTTFSDTAALTVGAGTVAYIIISPDTSTITAGGASRVNPSRARRA